MGEKYNLCGYIKGLSFDVMNVNIVYFSVVVENGGGYELLDQEVRETNVYLHCLYLNLMMLRFGSGDEDRDW